MSYTKKEREQYNQYRQAVASKMGLDKTKFNYLRRIAHKLHEADENSAMGSKSWRGNHRYENDYKDKDYNKDVNEAFKKAGQYRKKKKLDVHFYHQRDPRGATLHVSKERMSSKDYPSKGHPIY